jgi:hypothetical protein
VQAVDDPELTSEQAAAGAQTLLELAGDADDEAAGQARLTAALLTLHAQRMSLSARQRHLADRFTAAHPGVPVSAVPALAEDVHDLEGLRTVGSLLASSL